MDPIAKLEVVLNSLNTALAYALHFKSTHTQELENLQYQIYHSAPLSSEQMDVLLTTITRLKSEIIAESHEVYF